MDPQRLVLVETGGPDGWGTGYLIGPQLVLTALHVVLCEGRWAEQVTARVGHPRFAAGPVQAGAQVCWPDPLHGIPPDDALDLALLWLDKRVNVGAGPVRWGRPTGVATIRFEGAAFPTFAAEGNGAQAQFEYLRGELAVVSTAASGWVLDCPVWPAHRTGGRRPWAGASGAAVFCHGLLVGVAVEDDRGMDWRRLHAVPIHEALATPGFAAFIDQHGHPGTTTTAVNVTADVAPANWPRQVGVLPPLARAFQHRDAVINLARALAGGDTIVRSAAPSSAAGVVTGTGGVGKTQLAVYYTHAVRAASGWPVPQNDHGDDSFNGERSWSVSVAAVDLLVWVQASSAQAVVATYAQAAAAVSQMGAVGNAARPGGPAEEDQEAAAGKFLTWLQTTRRSWLIVLDDVPDAGTLRGLWPPETPSGRTLITTRNRDTSLAADRNEVVVGLFTSIEAIQYLTTRLAPRLPDLNAEDLGALASELGHLPLALAQAASYIIESQITVTQYRTELADRGSTLADVLPDISGLPDDQRHTVAAAWTLSISYASNQRPVGLTGPLLQVISLLDPNGIPISVLCSPPVRSYLDQHREVPGHIGSAAVPPGPTSAQDVVRALRLLHRLNLAQVDVSAPAQTVRIHQLLQRAVREPIAADVLDRLGQAIADGLLQAWADDDSHSFLAAGLHANVVAFSNHVTPCDATTGGLHRVLFVAGRSLGDTGQVTAACSYLASLCATALTVLGPDHPDTLVIRGNLAGWQGEAGDAAGAATAFEELLTDHLRILGPDDPDTLVSRGNLAGWRGRSGDAAGAATAFEELLTDHLRILGPDHPHTLTTRSNVANWRGQSGDPASAATAHEALLTDHLRILGPDHPHTLTTRRSLAGWRGEAGNAAGAATAFEELLTDHLRILGPDHPHTLTTRCYLAIWRGESGDAVGAATALEQLLADQLRILGPDHPDTLTTRNNLAGWRGRFGDAAGAASAFEELLTEELRISGPDHPHTLTTRNNLAAWRGEAGDVAGAITAYETLLTENLRIFGPDHPQTFTTRNNLAAWRGEAGDVAGAITAYETLLTDRHRILGPDHPDTLNTRHNLAFWQGQSGDLAGAIAAYEELLTDRLRILGPAHPHTLSTQRNLAGWRNRRR
ncbi:tetratricopeptide repeat protein [Streptomyces bobili]|uniref:tetratricopeptide repeat protein n=1 Tax=Streptomyces bobili TaxID=67280 RepID=UPI0034396772